MNVARPKAGIPLIVWQALPGLAALALWQWMAAEGWLDPLFFSRPTDVASAIAKWFASGTIWRHLVVTTEEALLAFLAGSALGVAVGLALARGEFAGRLLEPYIRVGNALPRVVLAPIFLLWFGLGIWSKVALGVTVVFFIVFLNTYRGIREVDPVLIDNARMLGASERQLLAHVLVPNALTWIFSSLQISIGFAIIAVVVGEYLGATQGIGYLIAQAEGVFDTTAVFAGIAVLSAVVLAVGYLVSRLEARLLRWKPEHALKGGKAE